SSDPSLPSARHQHFEAVHIEQLVIWDRNRNTFLVRRLRLSQERGPPSAAPQDQPLRGDVHPFPLVFRQFQDDENAWYDAFEAEQVVVPSLERKAEHAI